MSRRRQFASVTDYRRPYRKRIAGFRVLIVCEGSKTEPTYIRSLKPYARSLRAQLDDYGAECGSDPQSVAEYLSERLQEDSGYDLAFALVDVDSHDPNRAARAQQIVDELAAKLGKTVFLISSNPCIEYWFILHFEYTRAPFSSVGEKSAGDAALARLKLHLPEYGKSSRQALEHLVPLTGTAIKHAEAANKDAIKTDQPNPSTGMPRFFAELERIAAAHWQFNAE